MMIKDSPEIGESFIFFYHYRHAIDFRTPKIGIK